MGGRSKRQRRETPEARRPGAGGKVRGALTAAASAARDSTVETVREGMTKAGEKIGKVAGAGLTLAATGIVEATGHHPSPLIAVGAGYAGMAIGGVIGKTVNAGLDRIGRGGPGLIAAVMADLSRVLQAIGQATRSANEAVTTINRTQAYIQRAGQGTGNSLLRSANQKCRQAPGHLAEGVDELRAAEELVGQHLVKVAKTGR